MLRSLKIKFASEKFWNDEFNRLFQKAKSDTSKYSAFNEIINTIEYSHPHLSGKNTSYKKFIVLSKPRGGSTYLVDLLQYHPKIVCFSELFLPEKCAFSYSLFPKDNDPDLLFLRNKNPEKFLRHFIFRKYLDNVSAVGFKIFYEHGAPYGIPKIWKILKKYSDLHVIHLVRKNHLKSYASLQLAEKTNVWMKYDPCTDKSRWIKVPDESLLQKQTELQDNIPSLELDFISVLNYFKESDHNIDNFRSSFADNPCLEVNYEDLEKDPQHFTGNITNFLGVENKPLYSRFAKQNTKKMSELILNYSELKEKFSNTRWALFFEE
jgi:LPS sulfotransferase NodH